MKKITSGCELKNYVLNEYYRDDVELNLYFFDVDVYMKEAEILKTYADLHNIINGDSVIRLETMVTNNDGEIIDGVKAESFIPNGEYESFYDGNCKNFLERFIGKELETGFCRYDGEELLDFIF